MPAILLVDDEHDVREMIKESLVRNNYTVIEATSGKDALSKFKPSLIDLVVTDILMPDEDGLELIMKLRQLKPEIKIIAISGGGKAGPNNYLTMARVLGADLALSKPFSVNELMHSIRDMIV